MEDRAFPLTLLTPKHVYSAHATHTMLPWIRERLREPLLTVHPQDAAARGLTSGDVVRVFNDRGEFQLHCSVSAEVAPGVVSVPQGFWPRDYITGHPSYLATVERSDVQESIIETNYPAWEVAVNIAALKADSGRESVA
jgi:anaerobic selenocysteine-containing dehydrogenase